MADVIWGLGVARLRRSQMFVALRMQNSWISTPEGVECTGGIFNL
ncbi:MAG: hypothetical protein SF052_27815 [Bacteroidia bacterium]|nr:hypothetical protein [Bacteroidia bacterium]